MVVVGGVVVVCEILRWVTRAPLVVHHLDVQVVVGGDAESVFSGADARECIGVVAGSHGADGAGVLDRLVDDLEHADVAEVGVGVDVVGHPF